LRCDSKKSQALQKSHRVPKRAREEVRANEFHSGVAGKCLFPHAAFASSTLAVGFALVTVETVSAAEEGITPSVPSRRGSIVPSC
jgi:hypothetical protein